MVDDDVVGEVDGGRANHPSCQRPIQATTTFPSLTRGKPTFRWLTHAQGLHAVHMHRS